MEELRIIIAGGRTFNDYTKLNNSLKDIISNRTFEVDEIVIISGTARGADQLGERFANENGLKVKKFPADWETLGKRAGYVRNSDMAKYSISDGNLGMLVAFWDGESKGTKHMIDLANKNKLEVHIIKY